MNTIVLVGKVNKDATAVLVENPDGEQTGLVAFTLIDKGIPYTKSDPMFIEIDFMRPPAMNLLPFLKKGKEVHVSGCLRSKKFTTSAGEMKTKYYIKADYIILSGGHKIQGEWQ